MIRLTKLAITGLALLLASTAIAEDFDYYVLAISWNAGFCELEGRAKGYDQCTDDEKQGFVLHGLWPQYEDGWPEYCNSPEKNPSRQETGAMADIMGSGGSAWHQWNKHGRCTGLSSEDYYSLSREAFDEFATPEVLMKVEDDLKIVPSVIEDATLEANPELHANEVTIICQRNVFVEARICLNKDLEPTECLGRARNDCGDKTIALLPAE